MMDTSIIIVSYNTKEVLKNCIESVYANTKDLNFEVIVVDNDSKDGTKELITRTFSKHKNFLYIQNRENYGFSKANNIGIKKSSGKFVLFLNSDTLFNQNTIKKMIDFMSKFPKCGAATCKVLLTTGAIDDSCHRGFPTPWNAFCHFSGLSKIFPRTKLFGGYNLGFLDLSKTHTIDALAGSFMFVRREAGEDAGWWDEDYFFYGEDLDFCYTLWHKGWEVYYYPDTFITHLKGVSGGIKKVSKKITTADEKTRKLATKWRFNAMRIFYKKHYEQKYPWVITRLVFAGIALKEKLS